MQNALQITVQNDIKMQLYAAIDQRQLAESTARQYRRAVDNALAAGVELRDASALATYAAQLRPSSRAFLRSVIISWCEWQAREAKAQATPDNVQQVQAVIFRLDALREAIPAVDGRKRGQKAHTWLSRAETRRLFDSVDRGTNAGQRDRVMLLLLVGAGLRCEEAAKLTFDALKRQGKRYVVDVTGKGAKQRQVPINDLMARDLQQWQEKLAAKPTDRVLRRISRGDNPGACLSCRSIQDRVREFGQRIEQPTLAPHDLRRTYAQIGLDNGIPIQQISKLLGHASIQTTERYLNVTLNLEETISDFVPM